MKICTKEEFLRLLEDLKNYTEEDTIQKFNLVCEPIEDKWEVSGYIIDKELGLIFHTGIDTK